MTKLNGASPTIFRQIVLGLTFSLLSLLLFLYISVGVLNGDFVNLDNAILTIIYFFRDPLLTPIMHFVSFLGGEFTLLSAAVIVVVLALKKYKKEAVLFAFIVIFGYVLNNLIKHLLEIPRPDIDPLSNEAFYSFPSGHAMNSLIFYGLLAYLIFHFTRNRGLSFLVFALSIILILLIGFSRLYLGVHYPSDVLAGFIAGFWWLTTVIFIAKNFTHQNLTHRR